jgi:hypothetical protein
MVVFVTFFLLERVQQYLFVSPHQQLVAVEPRL